MPDSILRIRAVIAATGLSRSSVYRLVKKQTFPQPIALSSKAVGWAKSEIDAWVDARIASARNALIALPASDSAPASHGATSRDARSVSRPKKAVTPANADRDDKIARRTSRKRRAAEKAEYRGEAIQLRLL